MEEWGALVPETLRHCWRLSECSSPCGTVTPCFVADVFRFFGDMLTLREGEAVAALWPRVRCLRKWLAASALDLVEMFCGLGDAEDLVKVVNALSDIVQLAVEAETRNCALESVVMICFASCSANVDCCVACFVEVASAWLGNETLSRVTCRKNQLFTEHGTNGDYCGSQDGNHDGNHDGKGKSVDKEPLDVALLLVLCVGRVREFSRRASPTGMPVDLEVWSGRTEATMDVSFKAEVVQQCWTGLLRLLEKEAKGLVPVVPVVPVLSSPSTVPGCNDGGVSKHLLKLLGLSSLAHGDDKDNDNVDDSAFCPAVWRMAAAWESMVWLLGMGAIIVPKDVWPVMQAARAFHDAVGLSSARASGSSGGSSGFGLASCDGAWTSCLGLVLLHALHTPDLCASVDVGYAETLWSLLPTVVSTLCGLCAQTTEACNLVISAFEASSARDHVPRLSDLEATLVALQPGFLHARTSVHTFGLFFQAVCLLGRSAGAQSVVAWAAMCTVMNCQAGMDLWAGAPLGWSLFVEECCMEVIITENALATWNFFSHTNGKGGCSSLVSAAAEVVGLMETFIRLRMSSSCTCSCFAKAQGFWKCLLEVTLWNAQQVGSVFHASADACADAVWVNLCGQHVRLVSVSAQARAVLACTSCRSVEYASVILDVFRNAVVVVNCLCATPRLGNQKFMAVWRESFVKEVGAIAACVVLSAESEDGDSCCSLCWQAIRLATDAVLCPQQCLQDRSTITLPWLCGDPCMTDQPVAQWMTTALWIRKELQVSRPRPCFSLMQDVAWFALVGTLLLVGARDLSSEVVFAIRVISQDLVCSLCRLATPLVRDPSSSMLSSSESLSEMHDLGFGLAAVAGAVASVCPRDGSSQQAEICCFAFFHLPSFFPSVDLCGRDDSALSKNLSIIRDCWCV